MAKGYWIGRVDVNNEDGFKPHAAANQPIFKKFGGRYLVRAGKFDVAEGHTRSRNVVVEFPDYAAALACYRSPEYQENINRGLRRAAALTVAGWAPLAASHRPNRPAIIRQALAACAPH